MEEKILDLSGLNDKDFEALKNALDLANNNTAVRRYFGYVDKTNMKRLTRFLHYFDTRTFVLGGLTALAGVIVVELVGTRVKAKRGKKKEATETN